MLLSTCTAFWESIPTSLSAAVAALLSATAMWVASKARSTSREGLWTSLELEQALRGRYGLQVRSESRRDAPARRRSSTKATTST